MKRENFIESLRAMAAILVFTVHSTELLKDYSVGGAWLANMAFDLNLGRVGVVTFFVISGFLIPSSLHGERWTGSWIFINSRFFRLFPAFWASIPISFFTYYWLDGKNLSTADVLANVSMLPELFNAPLANGAYWTLEVELAFYAICLVLFCTKMLRHDITVASTCLIIIGIVSFHHIGIGNHRYDLSDKDIDIGLSLFVMFWGAFVRRIWEDENIGFIAATLFLLSTLIIFVYFPVHFLSGIVNKGFNIHSLRFVCGYTGGIAIFCLMLIHRRKSIKLFSWIGQISYSFYLLHGCCIKCLCYIIRKNEWASGLRLEVYEVLAFVISVVSAACLYHLVELPFIGFGKRLALRHVERVSTEATV